MSKNKTKRYLMVLAALGLVAIAAGGGSGTFASFNAQVANTGNVFASGTLYLHDVNGSTECASEAGTNNSNIGSGNGCATLFNTTLPNYSTTIRTPLSTGTAITSLPVTAVEQVVKTGDEIVVTDGVNTQNFFASADSSAGDNTISVQSETPNFAYSTAATVVDDARFAKLKLVNAGTLQASGIKVSLGSSGCAPTASNTSSNTGTGTATDTTLTLGTALTTGIPVGTTITIGGASPETVTTTALANPGANSLTVSALASSHTADPISWAISFGSHSLCDLPISIVETDSSYHHVVDSGDHALGCAFGGGDSNGYGCSFDATSHKLSNLATYPSFTGLSLATGGSSNTGTQLDANGGSRYFVIGIQGPSGPDNSYQNKQADFDLVWHIDQA